MRLSIERTKMIVAGRPGGLVIPLDKERWLKIARHCTPMILPKVSPSVRESHSRAREELSNWPAPGSEDTELGVLMELEVGHGETEVYAGVQA